MIWKKFLSFAREDLITQNEMDEEISLGANEIVLHTIFERFYHPLCFYAEKYLRNDEDVKDVVQEIFVTIWEKKLSFPNEYALKAYLYSSVYHSCIDRVKLSGIHKKHQDYILAGMNEADPQSYLTDQIETEVLTELFQAIEKLPAECGKVFKLSYLEGLPIEDVAQKLEISVYTVKSQRARARKLLQENLKDLYPVLAYIFFI